MSAKIKVLRLLGAGMVTLAVVPWLGVSPAAATGNGHGDKADKAAHAKENKKSKADEKSKGKADRRPQAKAEDRSDAKAARQQKARSGDKGVKKAGQKSDGKSKPDGRAKSDGRSMADPPGNNGTVKVHEDQEPSPVVKNQPHVCTFHLHGFNFDGSSSGTWQIFGHAPTRDNTGASGAWTADADGVWRTAQMTLEPGHYKAYAKQTSPETPGGSKQKVFWVRCGDNGGTPTPTESDTSTPTESDTSTPTESETVSSTPTVTVTETVTVTPSTTPSGGGTVTETVTSTSTATVTVTETVTVSPSATPSGGGTVTETVTTTAPGSTTTVSQPGSTGTVTVTETVTVGPGGVGVLPTKIGNDDDDNGGPGGDSDDTEVLGTKSGVLAATGLDLPMGAALGLSFALLLAGGALMVVPGRQAVERDRRH